MLRTLLRALVATLLTSPAFAQANSATVLGTVFDAQQAVLPGAIVVLKNLDTSQTLEAPTDRTGNFRIVGVAPGRYELRSRLNGFAEYVLENLSVAIGADAELSITMQVGLAQNVTVVGEATMVGGSMALGRTFTSREIDALPITARDFINLALLTPGIFLDRSTGRNPNPSISASGQIGRNNTFILDGVTLDDHFGGLTRGSLSLDAVKEFMVRTNSFSAEYGQASGAVVAVITRSGTNRFMGRGSYYRRDDRWNARSAAVRLVEAPDEDGRSDASVFGGFFGGPIVRDRAFFLASAEHTARDSENIITSSVLKTFRPEAPTAVPVRYRQPQILGRADINLTNRQTLTVRTRFDRLFQTNQVADGGPAGLIAPERRHDSLRRDLDVAVLANQILSGTTLNEVRVQHARRFIDQDITKYSTVAAENRPGILLGQAPVVPAHRREHRWQLLDTLTHVVPDTFGDHAFKAGVDLSFVDGEVYGPGGFNGIWRFQNPQGGNKPFNAEDRTTYPTMYTVFSGDPYSRISSLLSAVFFEDVWKPVSRLTLNLGVRWDYEHAVGIEADHDNVAPRVGVAFAPWSDRSFVLRGGYGVYYDAALYRALDNSQSGLRIQSTLIRNPGYAYLNPDPINGVNPNQPRTELPPSVNELAEGLRTPYTQQASVGVARTAGDFSLSVDGVWAQGANLLRTRDINYPNLEDPDRPRPDETKARVRVRETEGHSWYRALLVGVQRQHANRHSFGVAYTFSRAERDTEDWEFIGADQRDYAAERGPSASDVRHRFVANLNIDLPFGVRLGSVLTAQSALPYNITAGRDLNGDDETGTDRPPGVGRNSGRGDDFWQLDVRLSKQFAIGGRRLELLLEAFNLTNHTNWSDYDGNELSTTYQKPTGAALAREIQVGVRIGF